MTAFRNQARIARHFCSTRAPEVLALQASPALGLILGGFHPGHSDLLRPGLLLLGSLMLTAHVFLYNDWAGYRADLQDPRRNGIADHYPGIQRGEIARAAALCLILAGAALALLGMLPFLLSASIAALSFLYSSSNFFGKGTPIMGSVNHLLGGVLHFLLGYTLVHSTDVRGLLLGIFFGLVFAGGHLNQEVRDHDIDRRNGIRTNAVVFGPHRVLLASLCMFTAAYSLLTGLAVRGILPCMLYWSPLLWLMHLAWYLQARRRTPGFDTAVWMQRRYHLLFALVGLAMLVC